jgi:hypothetical protein
MDSLYTRHITLPRWINANMCAIFFRQNSFCVQLFKHQAMNIYRRVAVELHRFLISALDGGDWSCSRLYSPGAGGGEKPGFPLDRRLGGFQSRSEHHENKHLLALPVTEPQFLCSPAHSCTDELVLAPQCLLQEYFCCFRYTDIWSILQNIPFFLSH